MLLETIYPILLTLLLVLAVRVSRPFKIPFAVTESSANTYTRVQVPLPTTRLSDKIQGVEIMGVHSNLQGPDIEDDQTNNVQAQLVHDEQSGLVAAESSQIIWNRIDEVKNAFTTSGSGTWERSDPKYDDLTVGGEGILLTEQNIDMGVKGLGNAGAKAINGWIDAYIVELDAEEVALQSVLRN